MTGKVYVSPLAESDLRRIGLYTRGKWGGEQARNYLKKLESCFIKLSKNPELGRLKEAFYPNCRVYLESRHLIFYRAVDDGIEIGRVLHIRMDIGGKASGFQKE